MNFTGIVINKKYKKIMNYIFNTIENASAFSYTVDYAGQHVTTGAYCNTFTAYWNIFTIYIHYLPYTYITHTSTSTYTYIQQEEEMNYIYCDAENICICFNISFSVFCLNVLKFLFSLVDPSFELTFCEDWLLLKLLLAKSQFQKFRRKITYINTGSRGKCRENTWRST